MLIRGRQMARFEQEAELHDGLRLLDFLRTNYPEDISHLTDRELVYEVVRCVARARAYGMTSRWAVTAFVSLCFVAGPEFDRYPPVSAILLDERIEPNKRIDAVLERITLRQWHGVGLRRREAQDEEAPEEDS